MKWKIKNAVYDKEDGISCVTISTKLGLYDGVSCVHPDDMDIASEFEGCRYAELRAVISFFKDEINILKIKIETLQDLLTNYQSMKYYSDNKKEIKCLKSRLNDLIERKERLEKNIEAIKKHINYSIENYRADHEHFIEAINKNKDKKEKKKLVPED